MNKLAKRLIDSGIPAMAATTNRIPLGGRFKTPTGQWAIEADGRAMWHGHGEPVAAPGAEILSTVAGLRASHVPDPEPTEEEIRRRDARASVTKDDLIDAILDPAKREALRRRLS